MKAIFNLFNKKEPVEKETGAANGKKKKEPIKRSCLEILPIRFYSDKLEAFSLENASYMDILSVIPRDLSNIDEDEMNIEILNFMKILKTVSADLKFISINFPLNLSRQKDFLEYKIDEADDPVKLKWLEREYEELEKAENNINTFNFFLIYFGEDEKAFLKAKDEITTYAGTGHYKLIEELTKKQKIQVLKKICNMNTIIDLFEEDREEETYG